MNDILLTLGDLALISTVPALALFVGYYAVLSPWRKTRVGRSLMYFALALLTICIVVLLSLVFGTDYAGREWVRLICFGSISLTTWRLFFTLRYIQKSVPPAQEDQLVLTAKEGE